MRARACLKCKEYVLIHPNNPINQNIIKEFELTHMRHVLITVNLTEIKDQYKRSDLKDESLENKDELPVKIT